MKIEVCQTCFFFWLFAQVIGVFLCFIWEIWGRDLGQSDQEDPWATPGVGGAR